MVEELTHILQGKVLEFLRTKSLFVQELDRSAVPDPVILHKCQNQLSKKTPHEALGTLQRIVLRNVLAAEEE